MKKFEIRYVEAIEKFWELAGEGKIDLLDTEMMNSRADVTDVYDEK